MDTYYNNKLPQIYNGNSVNDVPSSMVFKTILNTTSQVPSTLSVFKFTTAPNNKLSEVEANTNKPSPKFEFEYEFEIFLRKPDDNRPDAETSIRNNQPLFPPPTYPESKNNKLAPPTKTVKVDSQATEAYTLIDRIMKETRITDADKLIQMLKKLQLQEEHNTLMAKCPEPRIYYISFYGKLVSYLDVEDVLGLIIPDARICNSDIAQLNHELYDILITNSHCANRGRTLGDYTIVRNNTQIVVHDFAKSDFPIMYNYIKEWSDKSRDHILIA